MDAAKDSRRPQAPMRDLVALSTLPARWSDLDLDGIASSLADALVKALRLDLICVRLEGEAGEVVVEAFRSRNHSGAAATEAWRGALAPLLSADRAESLATIADPFGPGTLRVAISRSGIGADRCVLVTGSRRHDFPTEQDEVLLRVGAVQTATVVQQRRSDQRVRQTEARTSAILETALDCIITMDHEGKVVEFNPAAERTFGYRRAEVVGRELAGLIIPPALRDRHRRAMARYLATGEGRVVGKRIELSALRADGTEFPVELAIARIPTDGPPLFTAYLRDISERTQNERHRNIRLMVSQVLAEAASVSDAASGVLRAICESIGWEVGFFWTLEPGADELDCLAAWHAPGMAIRRFEASSRQQKFRRGEGLPGGVWDTGEAAWVLDVVEAHNFPRVASAAEEGLHGAFACPLVVGGETVGAIEFFSQRIREPDVDLLETMTTVGGLIAQFVQRNRANEALRANRERLDLALQAADLGHWELSLSDHTSSRNLRHDQIFGYDELRPEWTYEQFLTHVVPEHREAVDASFRRAVCLHAPWDFECRIRRADGEVRWIWARGRPFEQGDGRALRMAGTVADITDRKQIEQDLRDARARLDAALAAGAIVTWTWDIPNNRLLADESLARLFEVAPDDAEGGLLDHYVESIHPDDRDEVMAALLGAVERGETYEADYRIVQRDGSVRWVTARGRAERDALGRPVRMPGVLVDITERKRLEDELRVRLASLRESEEKLRLLADTIPQLAWMARPDGHIFWFNRGWYEYTGTTPEQMEGWRWQSVHDPEVLPRVLERWKGAIASGEPFEMVFPLRGADGEFRPFLTRVNPWRDDSGRILYWCGTNTDISEMKRMEDALRETDRRKDEFLATLAHELRNPLAPIRNSLQILKIPRLDSGTAQKTRDIMDRQVDHLVRLVDDLLDVSRAMRGKIDLRKEPLELATVVARAVETAQPLIDVRGHQLEISLPSDSLLLDGDPVRLAQVVGNLLMNAAKYTEAGGRISVSARRDGGVVALSVRDTGIGIAPNVLHQVFELFVQADPAATRSQGGLGIGLTLAKHLVEMHGGTIEAHSAGAGKGSEFVVRLPLRSQDPRAPGERESQEEVASSGLRVLVVDDNEDAAKTLALMLELQGHEVRVVHDGVSALQAAKKFCPALILLDLGMPGMDGYDVARQIRQAPEMEYIVLAALTGWGQPQDRRRTAEAGFAYHLVKPADPKALEDLLRDLERAPVGGRS